MSVCHLILLWSWLFTSFCSLWGLFVVPSGLVDIGLGYLFEMFLSFLGRKYTINFPLRTAFTGSHKFWTVVRSFSFVSRIFLFLPWSHPWPIHCLVAWYSISMSLCVFEFFPWGWFLVSFPCDQRKCLIRFQFSWICWACFVTYHVVYLWNCSMCIWKECVFCFFGMKGSVYISKVHLI